MPPANKVPVFADARALLERLISFQTVSSREASISHFQDCAHFLATAFDELNFDVELLGSPPLINAYFAGDPSLPELVIYGHYDVQPAGGRDEWGSDPFIATYKEGRIFGRGAQDNKGQIAFMLCACAEALTRKHHAGSVRILLDGEEEIGSPSLCGHLPHIFASLHSKERILLTCDGFLSPDNGLTLTVGARGFAAYRVRTYAQRSYHSGHYGNKVPNPAHALSALIHNLTALFPKPDNTVDNSTLNSFDVTSSTCGTAAPSWNTLIPQYAEAVFTFRSSIDSHASNFEALICEVWRERVAPQYSHIHLNVSELVRPVPGWHVMPHATAISLAQAAAISAGEKPPRIIHDGGSSPGIGLLLPYCSQGAIVTGFGNEGDFIHAPNESFEIERMMRGKTYTLQLMEHLGRALHE